MAPKPSDYDKKKAEWSCRDCTKNAAKAIKSKPGHCNKPDDDVCKGCWGTKGEIHLCAWKDLPHKLHKWQANGGNVVGGRPPPKSKGSGNGGKAKKKSDEQAKIEELQMKLAAAEKRAAAPGNDTKWGGNKQSPDTEAEGGDSAASVKEWKWFMNSTTQF